MSRFNNYAKRLNEIANATFEEYRRAEAAVKSAESCASAGGHDPNGVVPENVHDVLLRQSPAQQLHS